MAEGVFLCSGKGDRKENCLYAAQDKAYRACRSYRQKTGPGGGRISEPAEKKEQHSFSTDGKEGGLQEEEAAEQTKIRNIQERAEARKRELECSGKKVEMLKEEPFLYAKDSVEYKVHLMIWKTEGRNRKVDVETIN